MDPSHAKNTRTPTAPSAKPPRTIDQRNNRETLRARNEVPETKPAAIDPGVPAEALLTRQERAPGRNPNLPKLRDLREDVFFRAEYLYLHKLINLTGHNSHYQMTSH